MKRFFCLFVCLFQYSHLHHQPWFQNLSFEQVGFRNLLNEFMDHVYQTCDPDL